MLTVHQHINQHVYLWHTYATYERHLRLIFQTQIYDTFFPYLGTTNTLIYITDIMHIVDCYLTTEINLQLFLIQLTE